MYVVIILAKKKIAKGSKAGRAGTPPFSSRSGSATEQGYVFVAGTLLFLQYHREHVTTYCQLNGWL